MAMELEIKKLTPQNLNDFLTFFETDAHADNPQEDRCYCVLERRGPYGTC